MLKCRLLHSGHQLLALCVARHTQSKQTLSKSEVFMPSTIVCVGLYNASFRKLEVAILHALHATKAVKGIADCK